MNLDTGVYSKNDSGNAPKIPMSVSISGLPSGPIPAGGSVSATASAGPAGPAAYTWYLNGTQDGTGASYSKSGLQPGAYTLSVVAIETDGSGAASASGSFVVEGTGTFQLSGPRSRWKEEPSISRGRRCAALQLVGIGGSIDDTGVFTAPDSPGTVTITVKDSWERHPRR